MTDKQLQKKREKRKAGRRKTSGHLGRGSRYSGQGGPYLPQGYFPGQATSLPIIPEKEIAPAPFFKNA